MSEDNNKNNIERLYFYTCEYREPAGIDDGIYGQEYVEAKKKWRYYTSDMYTNKTIRDNEVAECESDRQHHRDIKKFYVDCVSE